MSYQAVILTVSDFLRRRDPNRHQRPGHPRHA